MQIDATSVSHQEISGRGEAYDRLHEARDAFLEQIEAGTAKPEDILSFVLLIDNCGYETIPQSEGMAWLRGNPETFAQIVGNVDVFMRATLHAYEAAVAREDEEPHSPLLRLPYWFFKSFLGSSNLLLLLSPQMREQVVREWYPRFGAWNNYWIKAAILSGIERRVIAGAILERLRRAEVKSGSSGNAASSFIQYGAGDRGSDPLRVTLRHLGHNVEHGSELLERIHRDPEHGFFLIRERVLACNASVAAGSGYTHRHRPIMHHGQLSDEELWRFCFGEFKPWHMLTNQELSVALEICASKDPNKVVSAREKMQWRLPKSTVNQIIAKAVENLTSLSGIPQSELDLLSVSDRKALAKRLDTSRLMRHEMRPTFSFLLRLVVDLEDEGEAFFREVVAPLLSKDTITHAFIAWKRLELDHPDLEDGLEYRLDQAGWWYGQIQRGRHPRGGTQWLVWHGNLKMVQSRYQHRYFPSEGDLVLYRPEGHYLTPRVVAVNFTPIMKDVN